MILLSALLASLSGLVSGERQPAGAPTQVQASTVMATAEAVTVAAISLVAAWAVLATVAGPRRKIPATAYRIAQPRLARRLALKQSWLN